MLLWANRRSFFPCVHARMIVIERLCVQSAITTHVKQASRRNSNCNSNQGDASVPQSKVQRQHAHHHTSAGGDAKISVCNAGRQDVNGQPCNGNVRASQKGHSVDGDVKGFECSACKPYAKMHSVDGDARVTDSMACGQIHDTILASSSKFKDKCLPSDVSNASGETQSRYPSLQTLLIQTQKKAPKALPDLQQKVELLESEQFSLSDAAMLVKKRAFRSCSFEQLLTVLQVLKEIFPSTEVVHDIVVRSSNILLEPAELVQQKLKLLYDFQFEEKVVTRLCSRGKVLSLSVESLQKKLMFFKDTGWTVEVRNVMFFRGPLILMYSIEKGIQPTLHFLESIGLTRESIWNLGRNFPQVFYMSVDNNLARRYEYFRQLGFSAKEFPKLCCCVGRRCIKSIEKHMQYLKDRGFTDEDVLLMVKKQPSIFSRSRESMRSNLDFLIFEQKRDMAEIVQHPFCLTLSLQHRMVPRFKLIKELGSSKVYSLSYILSCSDSMFRKKFGKREESGSSAAS